MSSEDKKPDTIRALVVDDEPGNRDFLVRLLQQAALQVNGAGNGAEALEIAKKHSDDLRLIMLDHQLPDQKGVDLVQTLRQHVPDAKIVMTTMHDERSMMRQAFENGCTAWLVKPHGFMEIFKIIKKSISDPKGLDSLDGLVFDLYGSHTWRG